MARFSMGMVKPDEGWDSSSVNVSSRALRRTRYGRLLAALSLFAGLRHRQLSAAFGPIARMG